MELNRQVFKAPSIPKIGRRTVSSSVMRGALKPQIKLNKSVFSFIKPSQKTVDVDKISGSLGGSAEKQLEETNRILVEIQKQLALDFGYRIAEEKKALATEKKRIAAQKVADKESRLEKDSRGILGKTFDKVVAPFKSIFQKLIDFFSIILTGILLNTAFKWLSNPENRKKLGEFFNFLKEYWQELLIVFGIAKLAKLVAKIFGIAKKLKSLLDFIGRFFGKGKGKKPKLPCDCPPKGGPGSGNICKEVFDCVKDKVTDFVKIFTPYFQPISIPIAPPIPVGSGKPPKPIKLPVPVSSPKNPKPFVLDPQSQKMLDYDKPMRGNDIFGDILTLLASAGIVFGGGAILGGAAAPTVATKATTVAGGGAATSLSRILSGAGRISKTAPKEGVTLSRSRMAQSLRTDKLLNQLSGEELATKIATRASQLAKSTGRNKVDLRQIYNNENSPLLDRMAARQLLKKLGDNVPKIAPEVSGVSSPFASSIKLPGGFSGGGTVGGLLGAIGPIGSLLSAGKDVIPAMLAKGEEVIRTSSAMLFRPLLKDINDHAGKLWQAFSQGTTKQNVNNMIQSELNKKFNDLIKQFKELIDDEIKRVRKTSNKKKGEGGGKRPQYGTTPQINISQKTSQKIPQSNTVVVNQQPLINSTPIDVTNNISQPNLNLSNNRVAVIPLKVRDLQNPKQQPKVNVINLPAKTVNLGPKTGSVKTPSSGSATEVPSISPFDASNPYISSNRLEYGMIM